MSQLLWKLFPAVRRPERSRFLFFLCLSLFISVAQTCGLVSTEAMLLARMGAKALPVTFVLASLATVVGSLIYAVGVQRAKNDRLFIDLLLGFGVAVLLLGALAARGFTPAFPLLVCLYYLSQCVLTNHYWTFTGDFFDTLTAKRLFPIFVVGNSLGGMLGGLLLVGLSGFVSPIHFLAVWTLFLVLTAWQLRVSRPQLRRWGPLELEESDETSMEGIFGAITYVRQSALGRGFVFSATTMVLALFVSQYLYSDVFAKAYPTAEQLSDFLGRLLFCTNALEVLLEVWAAPRLIHHLGVATSNLVHPVLTLLAFLGLAGAHGYPHFLLLAAIVARINRETVENAIAAPIRNLTYNALPVRFRGRVRAFLEGIVIYSGMAVAGLVLWLGQESLTPLALCYVGAACALGFLNANLQVRREYVRTLVEEMRSGRLDLEEMGEEVAAFEVQRLGALWESLQSEATEHPDPTTLRLIHTLAERDVLEPLQSGARTGNRTWLRRACLEALGERADLAVMGQAATSNEPELRLAALGCLSSPPYPEWLGHLMRDPDPRVRAKALQVGAGEQQMQQELLKLLGEHPLEALKVLPAPLVGEILPFLEHAEPAVQAAAFQRLHQLAEEGTEPPVEATHAAFLAVRSPHPQVRAAAIHIVATKLPDWEAFQAISSALGDASADVRNQAVHYLGNQGAMALPYVEPYLESTNRNAVTAAIRALARTGAARDTLASHLRQRARALWFHMLCRRVLAKEENGCRPFLLVALDDAANRDQRLSFELLAHLEDPKVMRSVEKVLRFSNVRARSDALEVLSNLGDREAANLLVLMLEEGQLEDKLNGLPPTVVRPADAKDALARLEESNDRWVRLAVQPITGRRGEEQMERLLVLRKVPLFAQMTLEQLEAINQLLQETQYLRGETIFQEGELGDELYVLVEGQVRIVKGLGTDQEIELTRMSGVSYFGEMSILDDEPRSASVTVISDSRLLVLKGERLKELVFQMPEIAFEIFKVLTQRIRSADQRLNQMAQYVQHEKAPATALMSLKGLKQELKG